MRQDLTNLMDDVLPELLGLQTQKSSVNECVVFFFNFYVFWWFLSIVMASGNWRMRLELQWLSCWGFQMMMREMAVISDISAADSKGFAGIVVPPDPPGWLIVLFKVPLRSHLAAYSSNMFQYLNHLWTTSIDSNFAWISSKAIGV